MPYKTWRCCRCGEPEYGFARDGDPVLCSACRREGWRLDGAGNVLHRAETDYTDGAPPAPPAA